MFRAITFCMCSNGVHGLSLTISVLPNICTIHPECILPILFYFEHLCNTIKVFFYMCSKTYNFSNCIQDLTSRNVFCRYAKSVTFEQIKSVLDGGPRKLQCILLHQYVYPGVFVTNLCNALYDQLTRCRSHKLILLTNCYIVLGCLTRALHCVLRHRQLRYARTGRTNLTYEHLCERPPLYTTIRFPVTRLCKYTGFESDLVLDLFYFLFCIYELPYVNIQFIHIQWLCYQTNLQEIFLYKHIASKGFYWYKNLKGVWFDFSEWRYLCIITQEILVSNSSLIVKLFGYKKRLRILQLPIPYCVSLIMVTTTSHIFINIFLLVHFSAVKFDKGNKTL